MATSEIGHGVEEDDDEDPDMKVGEQGDIFCNDFKLFSIHLI